MTFDSTDTDSRLHFFAELLSYNSSCNIWTYDAGGNLLYTNCSDLVLDTIFRHSVCYSYMMEHAKAKSTPIVMSSSSGLMWGATFELDGEQLSRIHILGPIFTQTMSNIDLERITWGTAITPSWKPKYLKIMQRVPVLNATMFLHRVLMMQYCITGERLQTSDVEMQRELREKSLKKEKNQHADRIQIYMAEEALLRMIRCGDTNYQEVIQKVFNTFTGNQKLSSNPLQHAKLSQVQFIALCCQAAIEGGLSAETAYNRKDAYIQDVENAARISEISEIGKAMYQDFVMLVHHQRKNPNYSKAIQSCCDYIENHLEENISVSTLASRVGYTDYYLSRLFKKETGFSIDEYARNVKIERAKMLLSHSHDSIQSIAEALGFGGRNYFSVTFRKVVGIPPAEYRKKHQHL